MYSYYWNFLVIFVYHLKTNNMKKLLETKKITAATFKAFVKRNSENLFIRNLSDFDGNSDCIESVEDRSWRKTFITNSSFYEKSGVESVYMVGHGRDYFRLFEDKEFIGIHVFNSCGSCDLTIKK